MNQHRPKGARVDERRHRVERHCLFTGQRARLVAAHVHRDTCEKRIAIDTLLAKVHKAARSQALQRRDVDATFAKRAHRLLRRGLGKRQHGGASLFPQHAGRRIVAQAGGGREAGCGECGTSLRPEASAGASQRLNAPDQAIALGLAK